MKRNLQHARHDILIIHLAELSFGIKTLVTSLILRVGICAHGRRLMAIEPRIAVVASRMASSRTLNASFFKADLAQNVHPQTF